MQEITQQPCPNCHRPIQLSRLPLHIHMCSTIKLRQSHSQQPQTQPNIYPQLKPPIQTNPTTNTSTSAMCIFCGKQMLIGKLEQHMGNCQYRQIQCSGCGSMYPLNLLWQHRGVCRGGVIGQSYHHQQYQAQNYQPNQQPVYINSRPNNNSYQQNLHNNIQTFKNNFNNLSSILLVQGSKLANYCNTVITQNKAPILQNLNKLKQSLYYKIQDIFVAIASDPNTDPLPPSLIREIKTGQYKAKNNGEQEEICTICYCELQHLENIKILECKHIFHPMCIDKWMKINKKCPVCKHDQSVKMN